MNSNSGNIASGSFTNVATGPGGIILGITSRTTIKTFYYSDQWQLIQENAQTSPTATAVVMDQYVWGQAYVNELVLSGVSDIHTPIPGHSFASVLF